MSSSLLKSYSEFVIRCCSSGSFSGDFSTAPSNSTSASTVQVEVTLVDVLTANTLGFLFQRVCWNFGKAFSIIFSAPQLFSFGPLTEICIRPLGRSFFIVLLVCDFILLTGLAPLSGDAFVRGVTHICFGESALSKYFKYWTLISKICNGKIVIRLGEFWREWSCWTSEIRRSPGQI